MADGDQQQQQQQPNGQQQQQQPNGQQQQQQQPNGQQQQQQQPSGFDWKAFTAGEPDKDTAFFLSKKGFKSPTDWVRSHAELEAKITAKGVIVPGADAKPEEIKAFHAALGVPESADKYDLGDWKPPAIEGLAWDQGRQDKMLSRLHAKGATPEVVREAFNAYNEILTEQHAEMMTMLRQSVETATADLKGEWGGNFDRKMDVANRFAGQAFGTNLDTARRMRLADGTFLLDNPIIARAFAWAGEGMTEDGDGGGRRGGGAPGGVKTGIEAAAARKAIFEDTEKAKAAADKQHPKHASVVAELNRLDDIITAEKSRR